MFLFFVLMFFVVVTHGTFYSGALYPALVFAFGMGKVGYKFINL